MKKGILLLVLFMMISFLGFGQKTLTWKSTSSTDWLTAANWYDEGTGLQSTTAPASTDIVTVDNSRGASVSPTLSSTSAQTIKKLTIGNGFTLTLSTNTAIVLLTVGDGTAGNNDITIQNGGIIDNQAGTLSTGGLALGTNDIMRIDGGGKYIHNSSKSFGTPIPQAKLDLDNNSTIEFGQNSATALTASSRSYGNLTLSATAGKTYTTAGAGAFTVNGTLTLSSSNVTFSPNFSASEVTTIKNLTITSGTFSPNNANAWGITFSGNITNNGTLAFSSNQTITFDGTTTISGSGTVLFTNGLTLNSTKSITLSREVAIPTGKTGTINGIFDCGANIVSGAGGFTLASGATLKTASATGVAGSVTTSSKSFSSGANYEFNGATTGTFTTTPTAYTVNDLTINNASGVTLSQAFTVNGTLTMKSGSLALGGNTLSYTASGTLKYDGTGYSTTTDVEFPVSSGPASLNVNNADATNGLSLQGNRTLSGTLTIASGKTFNIPASTSLTVTGNTIINQTNGLVIKSAAGGTGSFICNGTVNSGTGTTKVERYIVGYTNPDDGWHLLACPLNSFDILTSTFKPTSGDDDLYYYDETQNLWINWLTEDFDFANNRGYLCSYKTTATKYFSGELNNTDRKIDNVSYTPLQGGGWHLIPNPFPCGITWNSAGMSASGYVSTASGKVLNGGRSYSDISDGGIIPAMNSFFMQVNNAANSITIPASFRTHSSTWLKNTGDELLMLTAQSIENTTYQETIIRFNDDATEGFDPQYDSPFLQGVPTVPRMYSLLPDNTELSLNTFPVLTTSRVVPLTFIKGAANTYSINVTKLENFPQETAISLEDTKTNITQDLRTNMVYTFSSSEGDNPKRFFVHFGAPNGVNETVGGNPVRIYSSGNTLYINGNNGNIIKGDIFVYNLMGQQMLQSKLSEGAMTKLSINAPIGYYLVKVITEKKATTAKVFIQ